MRTPLMLAGTSASPEAAKKAKRGEAYERLRYDIVREILESGVDPNVQCDVSLPYYH